MAETKSYWTAYRTATLIASPIVATCFWAAFRNWKSWVFVIQTAAISALVFFALWGITFVVSLIRTPGLLDKERDLLEEERDKDQQNNALAQVEEIKRLEDEAKAEAERRKVKCSFTVRVDKSETTPVRIRYAPFGSIMYPEMLVPTINLVVYNEGGEPLTMTGYRLQKTSPENDAPISVLHHRLVEREANIDITEGLFQAVAGSPPMTRNLSTTPSSAL